MTTRESTPPKLSETRRTMRWWDLMGVNSNSLWVGCFRIDNLYGLNTVAGVSTTLPSTVITMDLIWISVWGANTKSMGTPRLDWRTKTPESPRVRPAKGLSVSFGGEVSRLRPALIRSSTPDAVRSEEHTSE